jgi:hypothetical protein
MVLCNKSGLGQSRSYIVSTIDGQIDIRKTNNMKVDQGWQPTILNWVIDIKTGRKI